MSRKVGVRRRRRARLLALGASVTLAAMAIMVYALRDNIAYLDTPTQLLARFNAGAPPSPSQSFRLGGVVEIGTLKQTADGVAFVLGDGVSTVPVLFASSTPDLFGEGRGAVALGRYVDGVFQADELLARHDETYMPAGIVESLEENGVWRGE